LEKDRQKGTNLVIIYAMSDEIIELRKLANNAGRDSNGQSLPSTELRRDVPDWDTEEVHLRDYLDVLFRRKWLILSFLFLTFITTLVLTLSSPKLYKATASIEVYPKEQKVTQFEEVVASEMRAQEFFQTQVELLQNNTLALRVIERLHLAEHPVVKELLFSDKAPGPVARVKSSIKAMIKSLVEMLKPKEQTEAAPAPPIDEAALQERALLGFLNENLEVSPKRNTMIIEMGFTSPDRYLSQQMVNAFTDEFVRWNMEKKLESSRLAREFLMKQIDRAKIHLEKAEEDLNRFAKEAGIVSLDSKLNSIYRQLEELNSALAQAESELIAKASVYQQAKIGGPSILPQVIHSEVITDLKTRYAQLRSEYEDLTSTFQDDYPSVKALRMKMNSMAERIQNEEEKIFLAVANEYKAVAKKVETLRSRMQQQKQLVIDLNERATQYKIMDREVETNKGIYQSLLQRTKEIESIIGVSSSNIHIVDKAMLPIVPYKPNVKLNLLLALVVGLTGGIGLAFFLEYFADTITNPDEISDRFHIPILGVAPLSKTNGFPIEKMYASDPQAPLSEAVRSVRVSIQLSSAAFADKSFLLTSTRPSEGKTTMAANLAMAFAGAGEKVVLVDADMRRPKLHKVFDDRVDPESPGLSRFLSGVGSKGLLCQNGDNLCFIPAGPLPPNPVDLLVSSRFSELMQALSKRFDRVIIDGPPILGFADALVLSREVGGVVLVISMGETTRDAIRHFKKGMLNAQGKILGCIINKVSFNKRFGCQSYYKYYSYYHYQQHEDNKGLKNRRRRRLTK
jgi:polysaccharide biosynthesis transport protein